MAKYCSECNKKIRLFEDFRYKGKVVCLTCGEKLKKQDYEEENKDLIKQKEKEFQELLAKAPKIRCPYCDKWFPKITEEQYRESAELNVLKWAIVPAWGVVGALKNKPFIECPHCKMKIMQG